MEHQFRTPIQRLQKPNEENCIDYGSNIVMIGSCFSENIGDKLSYYKFDTLTNPYGVLFHPAAIERLVSDCLTQRIYKKEDLIFHNEKWHSFNHHSDFSNKEANDVLTSINTKIQDTRKKIETSSHIILTLGTAWVYKENSTGKIVANCHKIPQKKFEKKLLSFNEICEHLQNIITQINELNPRTQIIFTLSPIRHIKDGIQENSLSKALLLAAIHKTKNMRCHYFPAYEILMDDLRDYRFYKEDMIHPSQVAIDYIWELFNNTWISQKTKELQKEIQTIQTGLAHRPFDIHSDAHQIFLERLQIKIKTIEKKYGIYF
ncbi:MAG: GSCFA domain-containing protein [Flavicella sp.]